ncbi:hypothetical protein GobsT_45210 [Gemmata obscuriglobus]|uniref:Lipoprotein n=1 Tax=Gemmata obscuriglobus TaxID=114 RepID=A0A2Z3H195_9BACT|nr:hypothetical protein [Gemmata obscuriglobus]AWM37507.1 hypothetical protein C1280_11085 [Gemmata obscuriglobus]QEG29723.1 hypothetical protein GobsT_45210 [Gemmata obscuriglobus]VTS09040.1 Uncharacterized protein OS=Singulisphaera acidiphila (strain ATCC BAA-1392 / DSM 18658 / VKM B-2454 / MOB10) GN=Sinac_4926 PE=4 SV=1 [Gemmata obscuriglobus UQM 2246]
MRNLIPLAVAALVTGCGAPGRPASEVERARAAVTAALDGWKANEAPEKLKARPDPVDFADELRATHALTDYTVGKVDGSDKDVVRVTVVLKLKDKKGKSSEREAVYAVALRAPVVVSRDPYF